MASSGETRELGGGSEPRELNDAGVEHILIGLERWSDDATAVYGAREQRDKQFDVLKALRAKT